MTETNDLPRSVVESLQMQRFLDNSLVLWNSKGKVMVPTEGKPGYLTCTVCGTDRRYQKGERVLLHVSQQKHHKKCQQRLDAAAEELSKAALNDLCSAAKSNLICYVLITIVIQYI